MSNASEICFHYYFFIFPSDCRKSLSTHKGATNDYKIFHKARYGWVYEKKKLTKCLCANRQMHTKHSLGVVCGSTSRILWLITVDMTLKPKRRHSSAENYRKWNSFVIRWHCGVWNFPLSCTTFNCLQMQSDGIKKFWSMNFKILKWI